MTIGHALALALLQILLDARSQCLLVSVIVPPALLLLYSVGRLWSILVVGTLTLGLSKLRCIGIMHIRGVCVVYGRRIDIITRSWHSF